MKQAEKLAFGRRTRKNVKSGKTIRTLEDGTEMFDDYWTDSEGSDTVTTPSGSKLNNKVYKIPERLDSGLVTESNSGDIKNLSHDVPNIQGKLDSGLATKSSSGDTENQDGSKNKTSSSKKSVSVPDSEDVVSSSPTRSKHRACNQETNSPCTRHYLQSKKGRVRQSDTKLKHHSVKKRLVDDFIKFPENVSTHQKSYHGEKSVSNSDSDSEKSSQDHASPLTRSKCKVYDQQINTPSTECNLQSKNHTAKELNTKLKHKTVEKCSVENFIKCPENVLPHQTSYHDERSISNSYSDSEKLSQDQAAPLTRSKHAVYDQQINIPSTRCNSQSRKHTAKELDTKLKHKIVEKSSLDNFTKHPITVSSQCQTSYHGEKSVSSSDSDSEKSSQDLASPLTRSKHTVRDQQSNTSSTGHNLRSKKHTTMELDTKFKHKTVEKFSPENLTKSPVTVSTHCQTSYHGEKSISNSDSDSEKSFQDLASPLTRSKRTVHDQQSNTSSTERNLRSKKHTVMELDTKFKRKIDEKFSIDNFTECPITVSTQCQTSDHGEQNILTSNAEKSLQDLHVDNDHQLSHSGHNLDLSPDQSMRHLGYNKEKSSDLTNAKEFKMHRKVKWLSKSNLNSKKNVTETQNTAVNSQSPIQSPEIFKFRKQKNTAVLRSDTEEENFDKNNSYVKKTHKFKSKIPIRVPVSHTKDNAYHINTKDFNSDKISENAEKSEISGTVVDNEITDSHKKIEQKSVQSTLGKNLKRKKEKNTKVSRVSPRISAPRNNSDLLTDDNEGYISGDELPNKKLQVMKRTRSKKTSKTINKNLSRMKKQQIKLYFSPPPTRNSDIHPSHLDDASISELPSQRESLHNSKINDKHASQNSKSQCSGTEHRNISRSGRTRYPPLAFWKNERIQFQFRKNGDISISGVEKCVAVNEDMQMRNKGKKTVSGAKSVKASAITDKFNIERETKDLTTIPVIDASKNMEVEARIIRPFSSLEWDYPNISNPDYDDYIIAKTFEGFNSTWGFICIKPNCQKPPQFAPDEDIYFNVIKGKVEVELHTSKFVLKKGGSFIVPRANVYSITNIYKSNSILIFNSTTVSVMNSNSSE